MSPDDLESVRETRYWLSVPDIRESVAAAERECAAGETISSEDLRAEFGLPPR